MPAKPPATDNAPDPALEKARAACTSQVELLAWLHSDEGKALPQAERARIFETLRKEIGRKKAQRLRAVVAAPSGAERPGARLSPATPIPHRFPPLPRATHPPIRPRSCRRSLPSGRPLRSPSVQDDPGQGCASGGTVNDARHAPGSVANCSNAPQEALFERLQRRSDGARNGRED